MCEISQIPPRNLCLYYEQFENNLTVLNPRIRVRNNTNTNTNTNTCVEQTPTVILPQAKPSTNKIDNNQIDINSLLNDTMKAIATLNPNTTTKRLDEFDSMDKRDSEHEQAEIERKQEHIRKREQLEIDMLNEQYDNNNKTSEKKLKNNTKRKSKAFHKYKDRQEKKKDVIVNNNDDNSDDDSDDEETLKQKNLDLRNKLDDFFEGQFDLRQKIEEENKILEKDMDRIQDINCELRDIENNKKQLVERQIEGKRKFVSDKRSYVKINADIDDVRKKFMTKDTVPVLFESKYHIVKFMEDEKLLDLENAFDDTVEVDSMEYAIYFMLTNALSKIHDMLNNSDCDDMDPDFGGEFDEETTQDLLKIFEEFTEHTIQKYSSKENILITENEIMTLMNDDDDKDEKHDIFDEVRTHGDSTDTTTKPAGNSTYG